LIFFDVKKSVKKKMSKKSIIYLNFFCEKKNLVRHRA
jgi:hypothetical protein